MYRSPDNNADLFINGLHSYLNNFSSNEYIIICGDINIDILKSLLHSTDYLNIMSRHGFISCINIRIFNNAKT